MVDVNEFTREVICEYKDEVYSVRDNGAVKRHFRNGYRARKLDGVWTFGTKNKDHGYMMLNSHRVHIIVAKAFIPGNEDGKMVVDHKDTNRCNNRFENLRWLTRLENALLNEATLKRISYLCDGDITKFLENPSCLKDLTGSNQDIMWMRTVTAEEAQQAWAHISSWAKRPSSTNKNGKQRREIEDFEEWLNIHSVNSEKSVLLEEISSITEGVIQIGFKEKMHFPLCPKDSSQGLEPYAVNLEIGKTLCRSESGKDYTIKSLGWAKEWNAIQVEVENDVWDFSSFIYICIREGKYIHCRSQYKPVYRFCDSSHVLQNGAKSQCYFPLCPKEGNTSLEEYADNLQRGALFEKINIQISGSMIVIWEN